MTSITNYIMGVGILQYGGIVLRLRYKRQFYGGYFQISGYSAAKNRRKKPTIKTKDNKQKIIAYLKSNGQGKNKDFAELLGLKSTRIKELLYELVNEDVIKPQGSNRNRTYILTDKAN